MSGAVLDVRAEHYRLFWRDVLGCAAELATDPACDAAQHRLKECLARLDDRSTGLHLYPNCALFGALGGRNPELAPLCAFLYGASLRELLAVDPLYPFVAERISPPSADDANEWCPFALPDADDDERRVYWTLAIRLVALLRLLKTVHERRRQHERERNADAMQRVEQQERWLYHWYDAHLLLAIGLERVGSGRVGGVRQADRAPENKKDHEAPLDADEHVAALLERYSPDCHTALSECDLPDLSHDVERASFFAPQEEARKDSIYVDTFSKALPHRCGVREVSARVAEVAASDEAFFRFIQLCLAATYLGIYQRCAYRAGPRMRAAVYELFFFEPCEPPAVLGAHAREMQMRFDLGELYTSVNRALSTSEAEESLSYMHYGGVVAKKYANALSTPSRPSARRTARASRGAVETGLIDKLGDRGALARLSPIGQHVKCALPSAAHPLVARRAAGDRGAGALKTKDETGELGLLVGTPVQHAVHFEDGLAAARTMARMLLWKNCGAGYFDERRVANRLPDTGVRDRKGKPTPPEPPLLPGEHIHFKSARRHQLPCDRRRPSERTVARNAILYHWITVWQGATTISSSSGKATGHSASREFLFQSALNLALREYLIFALERWLPALRHELFARVNWASWETTVQLFGDKLRQRLDERYAHAHSAPRLLLTDYSAYSWIVQMARLRPINNHYVAERKPFLERMLACMLAVMNNSGFASRPVDHVLPRETELLLWHSLCHYRFPRTAPPLDLGKVRREQPTGLETPADYSESDAVFEPHYEVLLPPQIEYMIEPVPFEALRDVLPPPDDDDGGHIDQAWIERELVAKARYPLGVFHADALVLRRFAEARTAYHIWSSEADIKQFVDWLAFEQKSAYQFYLLRAYLIAVQTYQETRTVPLPRHIVDHQLRTLRRSHCLPDNEPVPQHMMRTLVCVGCQRAASVFPTSRARATAMPFGVDRVRFVSRTDDDEVFAHVRRRAGRPLSLDELEPEESLVPVLHWRAASTTPCYDRYCKDNDELPLEWLRDPAKYGKLGTRATEQGVREHAAGLLALDRLLGVDERAAQLVDRRQTLAQRERIKRPRGAPEAGQWPPSEREQLQLVAVGQGKLGELEFARRLDELVNERVAHYGGTSDGARSFLLYGHSMPGTEQRFDTIKVVDKTKRLAAEFKKIKTNAERAMSIPRAAPIATDGNGKATGAARRAEAKRKRALEQQEAKERRDAVSMARFAACHRRLMLEVSLCGRALRAAHLDVGSRRADPPILAEDDFIMACCDCLTNERSINLHPIGDRVVCNTCFKLSRACGGSVARRTTRGDTSKTTTNAQPRALSHTGVHQARASDRQARFSPSQVALCNELVPPREVCALDKCAAIASPGEVFSAREVLDDLSPGNETFVYVFFCAKHARLYDKFFAIPHVVLRSTVRHIIGDSRRELANVTSFGRLLEDAVRTAQANRGNLRAAEKLLRVENKKKRSTSKRQTARANARTMVQRMQKDAGRRKVDDLVAQVRREAEREKTEQKSGDGK